MPDSGGGDSAFFDQKAQNWLDALIRGLVTTVDGVSPTKLFDLIGMIRSDPEAWELMAHMMAECGDPDLRITYDEMLDMAHDSRRTFDSVMGSVTNALAFMTDPRLQNAFTSTHLADFTLDVLCENSPDPVFVFFVMPPEMTQQNAPLIRQFFSTLRTIKQSKPEAPTLNLVIDEAAQLGPFPEIAEFYSIGRGFGLCPVCVYQDIGQIKQNLGPTGAMTFSASADLEVYLGGGISDLETARHLSAKLGTQTIELNDQLTQQRAGRAMREAMHDALFGKGNAVRTGLAMKTLDYERGHIRKQALIMPSGYGIPPLLANKLPYHAMKLYRGTYGPNPYFDADLSAVRVPGWLGRKKTLRVIREPVPAALSHLPQYQSGEWSYLNGHRPKF
ncbi:type IV secretory system conjugative DNA transfer family protein [Yoonia sp. R2-816]|uniref:type IV secretory system conjugative DNA transfer family protein n=1 Tax=Yoonia sp. R2-816 TaxID=3342638 RepID=UPI00372859DD